MMKLNNEFYEARQDFFFFPFSMVWIERCFACIYWLHFFWRVGHGGRCIAWVVDY